MGSRNHGGVFFGCFLVLCCDGLAYRKFGGSFAFLFLFMLWVGLGGCVGKKSRVFERLAPPLFSFKKNEVPSHGAWSWGIAVVIEDDNVVK